MRRSPGEGSIVRLKDGRWQARLTVNGKRRVLYGKTRAEAARKLATMKGPASPPATGITVAAWLETWLARLQGVVAPRTLAYYGAHCRIHLAPTLGDVRLDALTTDRVAELQSSLLQRHSAALTRKVMGTLAACLAAAVTGGKLASNPATGLRRPRGRGKTVKVLTEDEVSGLLAACKGVSQKALITLALDTGMRQGELLGLKWGCVDLDAGTVRIESSLVEEGGKLRLKEPKTPSSRRVIKISGRSVEALQLLQASGQKVASGGVFVGRRGKFLYRRNVWRDWRALLKRAGLRGVRFHDLRHTSATLLLLAGVPVHVVAARLGHSGAKQTLDTYAHLLPGSEDGAVAVMGRLLA